MKYVGLLGVGNIGKVHLSNLLSLRGCCVSGIFDQDQAELGKVAHQFSARPYASFEEMLDDRSLDAVVIATPSSSHKELCQRALAKGKHVFLEKPLASTLEDSLAIVEAASKSDKVVQVGFCERFNVGYIEAKRAIKQGRLGAVRAIQSSRIAPYELGRPDWELGVLDTAVHNYDLILWLYGKLPSTVFAKGTKIYDDGLTHHLCTALISFGDGSLATDWISWTREEKHPLAQCAQSQMFIQGESGVFNVNHSLRPAWVMDQEKFQGIDTILLGGPEYYGCLKLQFDHFLAAISGEAEAAVTVCEALQTEILAFAVLKSLQTNQEIVLDFSSF